MRTFFHDGGGAAHIILLSFCFNFALQTPIESRKDKIPPEQFKFVEDTMSKAQKNTKGTHWLSAFGQFYILDDVSTTIKFIPEQIFL